MLRQTTASFERQKNLLATRQHDAPRPRPGRSRAALGPGAARPGARPARRRRRTSSPTPCCAPTPTASSPARSAEAGQVVAQAQPVYTLARDGPRDAVFNVHEWALANVVTDKGLAISLVSDPAVTTIGDVREISPAVNPSTMTITVKVGAARDAARDGPGHARQRHGSHEAAQGLPAALGRAVRDRRQAGGVGDRSAQQHRVAEAGRRSTATTATSSP